MQGYWISRPLPLDDFVRWLRNRIRRSGKVCLRPLLFIVKHAGLRLMMSKRKSVADDCALLLLFIALFTFGAQAQAIKEAMPLPYWANPGTHLISTILICEPRRAKRWANNVVCPRHLHNFNRYALRGNPGARTEQLYTRYLRLPMTNQAVITR